MNDARAVIARLPLIGRSDGFLLLAFLALVLAAAQGAVQQLLSGGAPDFGAILEWRVTPVLIWVLAAPLLIAAARAVERSTRGSKIVALVAHVGLAGAWIVVSNVLMRIPGALRGEPLGTLLADAMRGAVEYGPAAAAAYIALLALALPYREGPAEAGSSPPPDRARASRRRHDDPDRLAIRNGVRVHMIDRTDILWIEADGDHVVVHLAEKSYRTRATLSAFERELEPDGFLRLHRSALVNPRAIREIQTLYRGDHVAILRSGAEIRIPRTREEVIATLVTPIGED